MRGREADGSDISSKLLHDKNRFLEQANIHYSQPGWALLEVSMAGVGKGEEGGVGPERRVLQGRHHRGIVQEFRLFKGLQKIVFIGTRF